MKRLLAVAAGAALLFATPSFAVSPNPLAGKTVTYIVSTGPGGGYDSYGRLIARYLQKHLPGTRVLVRNVPGAGHIIGANTIYAAKPDGLTIGMFTNGLIYDQLAQKQGVLFDLAKFSWLGKAADDTRVLLLSKTSGFKNINDVLAAKTPIKFASSGVGSASHNDTRILAEALHLNIQIIPGFTGNEGEMSMLRNEVQAEVGTADSMEQFVKNGHGFWGLSLSANEKALPGVPRAASYIKDDKGKRLLGLLQALSELGRPTAGPPGIPANILAAERQALNETMADPAFLAEAKKLNLPINALPGEMVAQKMKTALAQPPETIAALKAATKQ